MRPWIVSFLAVAAIVAGILYFTQDRDSTEPEKKGDTPPETRRQTLTSNDVVQYLEIWPKIDAAQIENLRSNDPNAMRDAVQSVLRANGMSQREWDSLWQRIEDAVNAIRAEKLNPERLEKIDRILATKRAALESAEGQLKLQLESDIATLEAQRDKKALAIHPTDREVVMRYWAQLNAVVPRLR